jgi:hypothetical protein
MGRMAKVGTGRTEKRMASKRDIRQLGKPSSGAGKKEREEKGKKDRSSIYLAGNCVRHHITDHT